MKENDKSKAREQVFRILREFKGVLKEMIQVR